MKIQNSLFLFAFTFSHFLFSQEKPNEISDPRGAIIIADMKGAVAVTNNSTGAALPAASVQPGKILFDGHTIKTTGKDSSIVLLLSNGTVTTLKADSVLNIKKFTQAKFDPGATKLSELQGEPSSSETLIDLNIGDMVVDIKKLDKKSNFNIESPVGTAGIRGTRIGMNIQQAPGGGFTSKVTVPEGVIAFTPPPPPPPPPGAPPAPAPTPVSVEAGQAVSPSVTATGTVSAPPVAVPAPPADLAAVNADLDVAVAGTAEITVAEVATAVETVAEVAPPPADAPPADEPPADEPPADEPPADEPPADEPPADEPPADEPPAEPTEPANEPTEPANEPTEPATEPTEPATEPTEPAPPPAEPGPDPDAPAPPAGPEPDAPPPPPGPGADAPPPPPGPPSDAPPPPPPTLDAPPVDQTALRESNPVIKAKQLGIATDDPEAAATANAFVERKGFSAEILSSDEGVKSFVEIFDVEDGQAAQMRELGVDMKNLEFGDSLGELVAAADLLKTANDNIRSGVISKDEAMGYANNLVTNLDQSAKTFAKAAETGTPLDVDFQNNLIKNADNADKIGDVDFTDPMALLIVDLKAEFPQFAKLIDENKKNAEQIVSLVTMVGPERAANLFNNPESLAVFLDPANQLMGEQLRIGL